MMRCNRLDSIDSASPHAPRFPAPASARLAGQVPAQPRRHPPRRPHALRARPRRRPLAQVAARAGSSRGRSAHERARRFVVRVGGGSTADGRLAFACAGGAVQFHPLERSPNKGGAPLGAPSRGAHALTAELAHTHDDDDDAMCRSSPRRPYCRCRAQIALIEARDPQTESEYDALLAEVGCLRSSDVLLCPSLSSRTCRKRVRSLTWRSRLFSLTPRFRSRAGHLNKLRRAGCCALTVGAEIAPLCLSPPPLVVFISPTARHRASLVRLSTTSFTRAAARTQARSTSACSNGRSSTCGPRTRRPSSAARASAFDRVRSIAPPLAPRSAGRNRGDNSAKIGEDRRSRDGDAATATTRRRRRGDDDASRREVPAERILTDRSRARRGPLSARGAVNGAPATTGVHRAPARHKAATSCDDGHVCIERKMCVPAARACTGASLCSSSPQTLRASSEKFARLGTSQQRLRCSV